MNNQIKRIYDLLYSPIITPYNLLQNAKLENYEYVNYYRGSGGLIAEMKCTDQDNVMNIYYYHFDKNDFLKEIFVNLQGEKELIYSRSKAVSIEQEKYIENKKLHNKVG